MAFIDTIAQTIKPVSNWDRTLTIISRITHRSLPCSHTISIPGS